MIPIRSCVAKPKRKWNGRIAWTLVTVDEAKGEPWVTGERVELEAEDIDK